MGHAIQGRNERGAPLTPARPATFTIDGCTTVPGDWDSPLLRFAGYTRGQYWNGWACPYFPKETADAVIASMNTLGEDENPRIRYDPAQDAYVSEDPHFPGEPTIWAGEDLETTEGKKRVYAIGAFSLIWDEVEDLTRRCECAGSDVECGRTAVEGGLCGDCRGGACGHVHSAFGRKGAGA